MTKERIYPTLVLTVICLAVALLLAAVNMITAPIIEAAQNAASNEALLEVLPEGKNFKEITLDDKYPDVITAGYSADGGYVFRASVTGKSSGLIIMCGINSDGKIVGTKVIADQEPDDYDKRVFPLVEGLDGEYKDMTLESFEPFLVSGATLTSEAYGEAIKASLQAFTVANGGEVDIRTPEQILQDNCNEALGTEGVKFTKWFRTELISGIDAVYEAENNGGRVYVIGESFIGVKNGEVVTEGIDEENEATVLAADTIIAASTLTEITERPDGISKSTVKKIYVTASGNYVFEAKAEGYHYAQTDITFKVSISKEGRIIDCLTLEHTESKGYGDKCATEEYYDSWRGTGKDDVVTSVGPITSGTTDPGAIAGATQTSNGYQKAMKRIFTAFEILTEGGND